MLRRISSSELTEWIAYFSIRADREHEPENTVNTAETLKAMFAHRVKKKGK